MKTKNYDVLKKVRKTKEEIQKSKELKKIEREEKRVAKLKEKRDLLRLELSRIQVNTLNGTFSLLHLLENVGVKNRVIYFNNTEKGEHEFDRGLIFQDGTEIRHVSVKHVNYSDAQIVKKKERIPGYKPFDF